ncbi:unnamed protein product [Fructobacillus fructosus]|uniref:Uncharacterized protein n=1 Tax=Fructobacillus fructosus TaxID=1631 RepID=A0ABN9Z3C9_9LACO|nr:unnamed protein product [Fructobacillus fructosus]CAK1254142.1 unnamed protein product [Fructobacillus fructosus]
MTMGKKYSVAPYLLGKLRQRGTTNEIQVLHFICVTHMFHRLEVLYTNI